MTKLVLFAGPIIAGVVVGRLLGGRIGSLARWRIRGLWLVLLAATAQAVIRVPLIDGLAAAPAQLWVTGVSFAAVGLALALNIPGRPSHIRVGIWLALTGGALNGVVIAANGHMPVSGAGLRAVGIDTAAVSGEPRYAILSSQTRLAALGDTLPIGPLHVVVSIGDLFIVIATLLLIAGMMRRLGDDRRSWKAGGNRSP
ncbi:hypothetical protein Ais01nite_21930 [Asanoa ishikariensis]|uniref:DUF5317 domain-containing protein n=1 Tax=Asanoa ishikariensis TaxID=137265 RepID=A0A1H3U712_9ACTN|nr:DUF5317 family protein [Asanoa ishikariensis]GIF64158.1 hypothetical protein Ais01nite_21930 [Asanoa ishikariensis]SDZ58274.1 hypothetical protein SAMN05421684_6684 [Asanoa ishikariensis]